MINLGEISTRWFRSKAFESYVGVLGAFTRGNGRRGC